MALKPVTNLSLYVRKDEIAEGQGVARVALFHWRRNANVIKKAGWLCRLIGKADEVAYTYQFEVYAAAFVAYSENEPVEVRNVAAIQQYGPTMYATLFHWARSNHCSGVAPTTRPDKILPKPIKIWEKFATDYQGHVVMAPFLKPVHQQSWLNNIFSLATQANLVDYKRLRKNWKAFLESAPHKTAREQLKKAVERRLDESVSAHKK